MSAMPKTRWSMKDMLSRADARTDETATQDAGKVVTMHRSLDKLMDQIRATQTKLEIAKAKQTDLDQQWREFEQEKDRLTAEHQQEQAGIVVSLTRLQAQFAEIAAEAGLQLVLPRQPQPEQGE